MAKVTGIGGVFFKSTHDNAALTAWYRQHLGMPLEAWGGAILKWPEDRAEDGGLTVWHVAEKNTQWFSPSPSSFSRTLSVPSTTRSQERPSSGSRSKTILSALVGWATVTPQGWISSTPICTIATRPGRSAIYR